METLSREKSGIRLPPNAKRLQARFLGRSSCRIQSARMELRPLGFKRTAKSRRRK